ncbi:MAG: iron-containing alcohol dehydrogenase [bacterium]|nr:iron-containing alcohol dehydrogenase [bacterium]MDD5354217.1 iron-containing alcohol dehydrogenase [bacterium]
MVDNKITEFNLPTKIIAGLGSVNDLAAHIRGFGDNVLLITGKNSVRQSGLLDRIVKNVSTTAEIRLTVFDQVDPEPTCDNVNQAIAVAREKGCDLVVGIGGGSVLDVAKAAAALANKGNPVEEFMTGRELLSPGIPCVAIPTTAGTGAEVTPNSVLIDRKRQVKESLRHSFLYPKIAIIDAELTVSLPPKLTAYAGIDALCQSIESYVSTGANILTDAIALQSIRMVSMNLRVAYKNGANIQARQNMLYAALLSGIALSNARMGAVHGLAHPIGLKYNLPHGLVCGILLPYVIEFNLNFATSKYSTIAGVMGGLLRGLDKERAAKICIDKTKQLLTEVGFPWRLRELGVKPEDFPQLAKDSMPSGSLKANPRVVTEADVVSILKKAY